MKDLYLPWLYTTVYLQVLFVPKYELFGKLSTKIFISFSDIWKSSSGRFEFVCISWTVELICAKCLVTKRQFCYNEPEGQVLQARRARYTSPLGRVIECGGWISRGLWVMFSTGVAKSLFVVVPWNPFRSATDQSFHSTDLKFGQNMYCKIISRYFFWIFKILNFDPIFGLKTSF